MELRFDGVVKRFEGTLAVRDFGFSLYSGGAEPYRNEAGGAAGIGRNAASVHHDRGRVECTTIAKNVVLADESSRRDAALAVKGAVAGLTPARLIAGSGSLQFSKEMPSLAAPVARVTVRNLCTRRARPVDFEVRSGEVLGRMGLRGRARSGCVSPLHVVAKGNVEFDREPRNAFDPRNACRVALGPIWASRSASHFQPGALAAGFSRRPRTERIA